MVWWQVHTFFSRDAGMTWQMAREGSHIYEYGDHGAIIVVADDRKVEAMPPEFDYCFSHSTTPARFAPAPPSCCISYLPPAPPHSGPPPHHHSPSTVHSHPLHSLGLISPALGRRRNLSSTLGMRR